MIKVVGTTPRQITARAMRGRYASSHLYYWHSSTTGSRYFHVFFFLLGCLLILWLSQTYENDEASMGRVPIALKDVVLWDEDAQDHPRVFQMCPCWSHNVTVQLVFLPCAWYSSHRQLVEWLSTSASPRWAPFSSGHLRWIRSWIT